MGNLSKAEYEIMEVIWKNGGEIAPKKIVELSRVNQKEWKRQTVNTFLKRMAEKGAVTKKRGSVSAIYTKGEYLHRVSKDVVHRFFQDDLEMFVSAYQEHP